MYCQKPNDLALALDKKLKTCDSTLVFTAIVRSDLLKLYFPSSIANRYYRKEDHTFLFESNGKRRFLNDVKKSYNEAKNKKRIINEINLWCEIDSFLTELTKGNNLPSEQILYFTKETNFLFKKFLVNSKQNWESLSTWQSYELYIDFLNYVSKFPYQKRKELFFNLNKTKNKLLLQSKS